MIMNPNPVSGEPGFEPTPSLLWHSRSVSVLHPHQRSSSYCERSKAG